ncbi:unnamed protein product [Prunus armeniaca]
MAFQRTNAARAVGGLHKPGLALRQNQPSELGCHDNGWKHTLLFAKAATIHMHSSCPSPPLLPCQKAKWVELLLDQSELIQDSPRI